MTILARVLDSLPITDRGLYGLVTYVALRSAVGALGKVRGIWRDEA